MKRTNPAHIDFFHNHLLPTVFAPNEQCFSKGTFTNFLDSAVFIHLEFGEMTVPKKMITRIVYIDDDISTMNFYVREIPNTTQ